MNISPEYRYDSPESQGFENEQEEYHTMREQVQDLMYHSEPEDVADMLLILANVCEYRAMVSGGNEMKSLWYTIVQELTRGALDVVGSIKSGPRPDYKLENKGLYWPEPNQTH